MATKQQTNNNKQLSAEPPKREVGFWSTIYSLFSVVSSTARTAEKSVILAENEVDNLMILQQTRISRSQAELRDEREALGLNK